MLVPTVVVSEDIQTPSADAFSVNINFLAACFQKPAVSEQFTLDASMQSLEPQSNIIDPPPLIINCTDLFEEHLVEECERRCRAAEENFPEIHQALSDALNLFRNYRNIDLSLLENSRKLEQAIERIRIYINSYKDVLHPRFLDIVNNSISSLDIRRLLCKGIGLLLKSQFQRDPVEQIKKYSKGILLVSEYVRRLSKSNPQDLLLPIVKDNIESLYKQSMKYKFPSDETLKEKGISKSRRREILKHVDNIRVNALAIEESLSELVSEASAGKVVQVSSESSELESQDSPSRSEAVQAFMDTYDEWSEVYDSLAAK